MKTMRSFGVISVCLAAGCVGAAGDPVGATVDPLRGGVTGAVYALTNDPAGNGVQVFLRGEDGALTLTETVSTGGRGSGNGLGSQGAVVLSDDRRFLFAVNAGSDELSSFRVDHGALRLVSTVSSGGARPVSVTAHGALVYVLNAGGAGNISGFTLQPDGALVALPASTRGLSGAAATAPAQVQFDPGGDALVVTEKATQRIDTYFIGRDGTPSNASITPSAGVTPFGFAFAHHDVFVVSDAAAGVAGAGTTSSYRLRASGGASVVSGAVASGQGAPCWVAVSNDGHDAYVANAASRTLSRYTVAADGTLSLAVGDDAVAHTAAGPTDMAFATNERFLYVRNGNATIEGYRVAPDGSLALVATAAGLSRTAVGLAAW